MKKYGKKATHDISITIAGAIAFMSVLAVPIVAQQQGQPVYVPPVMERRDADMVNQRALREEESLRRRLVASSVRVSDPRFLQAVILQVKEDFERIQVVRNELVRITSANNALNYKVISDAAGEIRKRSNRLKMAVRGAILVQKFGHHALVHHVKEFRIGIELDQSLAIEQILHCPRENIGINIWRGAAGDSGEYHFFGRLSGRDWLDFDLNFGVLRVPLT